MIRASVDPHWDGCSSHGRFGPDSPIIESMLIMAGICLESRCCDVHDKWHYLWRPYNPRGAANIAELVARQDELVAKVARLRKLNRLERLRAFQASVDQVKRWPGVSLNLFALRKYGTLCAKLSHPAQQALKVSRVCSAWSCLW